MPFQHLECVALKVHTLNQLYAPSFKSASKSVLFHQDVMETICRLVRVVQCPHECGHAMIVSQGSPGLSTTLANLAAHLCDYSVFRINPSAVSSAERYTLENFKADLVSAYTRAGVKVCIYPKT